MYISTNYIKYDIPPTVTRPPTMDIRLNKQKNQTKFGLISD